MELFRLAKDVLNRKYSPIEYPVTLLGGVVVNNEQELDTFLLHTTWFTYRSGFRQFARSDCTSDKGWGCLIRTCQMMLSRVLTLHGQLDLAWFRDVNDDNCPFSIHRFIRWVKNPHEAFDTKFWTPSQGCEAIRNTLIELGSMHMLNRPLTSLVCADSTIIVEDVQFRLNDGMSVLLLLPTVTGLHRTITQGTYLCMEQLLQLPHCCGVVAGVPNRSYFIIGVSGQRFCFLDPHTTQPAFTGQNNLGTYYETGATLPAVAWNRIDSSILLGFYIASHSEWDNFVDRLADVKRKAGGVELFSIATKAMLKGGAAARKPAAQHLYMRRKMNSESSPTANAAASGSSSSIKSLNGGVEVTAPQDHNKNTTSKTFASSCSSPREANHSSTNSTSNTPAVASLRDHSTDGCSGEGASSSVPPSPMVGDSNTTASSSVGGRAGGVFGSEAVSTSPQQGASPDLNTQEDFRDSKRTNTSTNSSNTPANTSADPTTSTAQSASALDILSTLKADGPSTGVADTPTDERARRKSQKLSVSPTSTHTGEEVLSNNNSIDSSWDDAEC